MRPIITRIMLAVVLLTASMPIVAQNNLRSVLTNNMSSIGLGRVITEDYKMSSINSVILSDGYLTLDYDIKHYYGGGRYTRSEEILHHVVKINMKTAVITKKYDGSSYRIEITSADNVSDSYQYSSRSNYYSFYCISSYVADKVFGELTKICEPYEPSYSFDETGLRSCFSDLQKLFSEYSVKSDEVQKTNYHALTNNIRLSLSNQTLTITFNDGFERGYSSSALVTGKKELLIPLQNANFTYGINYSYSNDCVLQITADDGMDYTAGAKKNKITSKSFYADKLVINDVLKHLVVLKKQVIGLNYTGSLGNQTKPTSSKSAGTQKNTSISNKYEL